MSAKNDFLLDAMDWSYSRVSSFDQCPRMFDLTYLQCVERSDNAFAQWGTLAHSVLERYFRGESDLWDLPVLYDAEYGSVVTERFPFPAMERSYYERGMEYFSCFDGQIHNEDTILGVEHRYHSSIGGWSMVGVIDLVAHNRDGLVVCDHKSRGRWKSKEERKKYLRQLYLYSIQIKEEYGEYPSALWFNKFREGTVDVEPFNHTVCQEDRDWFLRSIDSIYQSDQFPARPDKFFCDFICSVRDRCEHSVCFMQEW